MSQALFRSIIFVSLENDVTPGRGKHKSLGEKCTFTENIQGPQKNCVRHSRCHLNSANTVRRYRMLAVQ